MPSMNCSTIASSSTWNATSSATHTWDASRNDGRAPGGFPPSCRLHARTHGIPHAPRFPSNPPIFKNVVSADDNRRGHTQACIFVTFLDFALLTAMALESMPETHRNCKRQKSLQRSVLPSLAVKGQERNVELLFNNLQIIARRRSKIIVTEKPNSFRASPQHAPN